MSSNVFTKEPFAGVNVTDAFALAAQKERPVVVKLDAIAWPDNLRPVVQPLASYKPGKPITTALDVKADVLILLYTDLETSALLDVFTHDNAWTPARKDTWYPYGHQFAKYKATIKGIEGNDALKNDIFGYLYAMKIGKQTVVLYKTELHPKANGNDLPFIPVIKQLVGELAPSLVISTGTAGAIGRGLNCGDVAVTNRARFHCRNHYATFPDIATMTENKTELKSAGLTATKYLSYAGTHLTRLSLPGLAQCYGEIGNRPEYSFLKKNTTSPVIYPAGSKPPSGNQPMDIVSADYLTVDDTNDSEGLQPLGVMNDTDDAFAFYALSMLSADSRPRWLSVRNASEPQISAKPFPAGTPPTQIVDSLKSTAGAIYGVYQYCTTVNSALACWGIVADRN